jgi:hypothetical protein
MNVVPYLLQFGFPGDDGNRPTDELGVVDLKRTRNRTRTYARVINMDGGSYNQDITEQEFHGNHELGWAISPILNHAWDWGNLESHYEALIAHHALIGPSAMPGITLVPGRTHTNGNITTHNSSYFTFDARLITPVSVNTFLSPIGGKFRIGY